MRKKMQSEKIFIIQCWPREIKGKAKGGNWVKIARDIKAYRDMIANVLQQDTWRIKRGIQATGLNPSLSWDILTNFFNKKLARRESWSALLLQEFHGISTMSHGCVARAFVSLCAFKVIIFFTTFPQLVFVLAFAGYLPFTPYFDIIYGIINLKFVWLTTSNETRCPPVTWEIARSLEFFALAGTHLFIQMSP